MKTIFIKPAKGFVVYDPKDMSVLPPEGAHVLEYDYWHRRILDGDVILSKPPRKPKR